MKLDKSVEARIKNAAPKKQKGASSLEYIMLAAAIIIILGVLTAADTGLGETVKKIFVDLFADAEKGGGA